MKKARYTLIYNRRNTLNKKGLAPIHIEVYFDRSTRKYVHTNLLIEKEYWDTSNRMVSQKHPQFIKLNRQLKKQISEIEDYEFELLEARKVFTPEELENYAKGDSQKNIEFSDFVSNEFEKYSSHMSRNTIRTQKISINHFNRIVPGILVKNINYQTIQEFDSTLHSEDYNDNTISKCHKHVKKFINLAVKKGLIKSDNNPYNSFKIKQQVAERHPLDFEESGRIEALNYKDYPKMQEIKDMFLFSCYTGLRISDLLNLRKSHLHISKEGISIQLDRMIKVKRPIRLDLFLLFDGKPQIILKKYLKIKDDIIFDKFTEQIYRAEVKVLAQHAKITKNVVAHTGRHTFGTQLAVITNGNMPLIMDLMGHSKSDTTRIYIKLAERMVNSQLRNVDWGKYS